MDYLDMQYNLSDGEEDDIPTWAAFNIPTDGDDRGERISGPVSLRKAMSIVRGGRYHLLIWNNCFGSGPHIAPEAHKLYKSLYREGFDTNPVVVLMEVLKGVGVKEATATCSSFALGLKYIRYIGKLFFALNTR